MTVKGGISMGNVYSYMRISTEEERGLQKFTRQENALHKYAQENNLEYLLEFQEDKSGKNFMDREQWKKLESIVQPGDTPYIKQLLNVAKKQNLVAKTSLENTVKLLLIVELDRAEQERETIRKRIKDGIAASDKKSGRPMGKLDKISDALKADIQLFLTDRSIKQIDLMQKHKISRNTLKKYVELAKNNQL